MAINKLHNDYKIEVEKERIETFQNHRIEMKSLQKEFGEATRRHLKLEKKLKMISAHEISVDIDENVVQEEEAKIDSAGFEDTHHEDSGICSDEPINFIPDSFSCSDFVLKFGGSKKRAELEVVSGSVVDESGLSFVSHSIASIEPFYSSFYCIPSLASHVIRLLDPWKEALAKNNIFRKLEVRYQEERDTCKQS